MAAAAFYFSIMGVFVKLAGQTLPSPMIVLGRAVVTLALGAVALRRARLSFWGHNRRLLVLRGVAGFIALYCHYYAVTHLPLADATVIQYTSPIFTVLVAAVALRERFGLVQAACAVVSLCGVVLVAQPSFLFGGAGTLPTVPVVVAVAGSVSSAFAYVLVRGLRATDHPLVVVFYFSLVAVCAALPAALPVWVWPEGRAWLYLAAVGVLTQLAQVHMTRGLHLEQAGRATSVGYLQVVFAYVWGIALFEELPTAVGVVGALCVLAGTFALARRRT
ncbi:MAG: DMT family transporter [Myxococcales bacterium]|nr:DMT family transporter [Myxococcales bacterium]